jgi:hypothetical protein
MAKLTLLDLTQRILNDMNGDEVNSISDTLESQQVAQVVRDTFDEIIASRSWPHLNRLITLTPHGSSRPTHMDTGETWVYMDFIKYNVRTQTATKDDFDDIFYMDPKEFLDLLNQRDSSSTDVDTITDPTGVSLYIVNNDRPRFWTTFDDEVIVFDSYDSQVETNLQASKTQCYGNVEPTWSHTDTAVPDLPAKAFPYLLAEAKSVAFNALMQVGNQKAEQQSRRQRVWHAREKWRNGQGMQFPDYGRKSGKR